MSLNGDLSGVRGARFAAEPAALYPDHAQLVLSLSGVDLTDAQRTARLYQIATQLRTAGRGDVSGVDFGGYRIVQPKSSSARMFFSNSGTGHGTLVDLDPSDVDDPYADDLLALLAGHKLVSYAGRGLMDLRNVPEGTQVAAVHVIDPKGEGLSPSEIARFNGQCKAREAKGCKRPPVTHHVPEEAMEKGLSPDRLIEGSTVLVYQAGHFLDENFVIAELIVVTHDPSVEEKTDGKVTVGRGILAKCRTESERSRDPKRIRFIVYVVQTMEDHVKQDMQKAFREERETTQRLLNEFEKLQRFIGEAIRAGLARSDVIHEDRATQDALLDVGPNPRKLTSPQGPGAKVRGS